MHLHNPQTVLLSSCSFSMPKTNQHTKEMTMFSCHDCVMANASGWDLDRMNPSGLPSQQRHKLHCSNISDVAATNSSHQCTNNRASMLSWVHRHSDKHATRHILEAQCAFKVLMIHEVLQFALHIAFRCVLHRCGSLDIRCWKLYRHCTFVHKEGTTGCLLHRATTTSVHPSFFWLHDSLVLTHYYSFDPSHPQPRQVQSATCECGAASSITHCCFRYGPIVWLFVL